MKTKSNMTNKQKTDWEKEFDNEFIYQYGSAFCCGGDYCEGTDEHTKKVSDDLKQFIKNTLTQQREEIIKETEGIVVKYIRSGEVSGSFSEGCKCEQCNLYEKKVRKEIRERLKQIK